MKKTQSSLVPDAMNPRENVVEDWNHINETVLDLGVPEMADIIGGQMFAGGAFKVNSKKNLFFLKAVHNVRDL